MKFKKHLYAGLALSLATASTVAFTHTAQAKDPKIAEPNSFVRLLHGVSGGPKVDVYVDGDKQLNDVTFGSLSKYLRVPAGYHTVRVTSNNPTRTLLTWESTLRRNSFYTLGVYGPTGRARTFKFNDSTVPLKYGQATITAFHLSPDAPPFSVYGKTDKGGNSFLLLRNLRYGQSKSFTVPSTPMTLKLVSRRGVTLKTITGASPRAGRTYDLFAFGETNLNFRVELDPSASQ